MHNKSLPGQLYVNNPYKPNVQAPDTRSSDDAATRNNGSVDQDIIKKPYKPNVEASDVTSNDAAMHKKGVARSSTRSRARVTSRALTCHRRFPSTKAGLLQSRGPSASAPVRRVCSARSS